MGGRRRAGLGVPAAVAVAGLAAGELAAALFQHHRRVSRRVELRHHLVVTAGTDLLAGPRGRLLGLPSPDNHLGREHEPVHECHLLPLRASNERESAEPA
jgi:hypothetical protein